MMKKKVIEKMELEKRLEAEVEKERADAETEMEGQDLSIEAEDPAKAGTPNGGVPSGGGAPRRPEQEPTVEELAAAVAALTIEREELKDLLLRMRAEFDNYRKRVARDGEANRKMAAKALLGDLLPVVDNLERGLDLSQISDLKSQISKGLAEGVGMVLKQFCEVLGRHGLAGIPAVGGAFDPNVHEAIMTVDSADIPENHVVQELQKGYRIGDYVLRPSKVSVSRGPARNEVSEEEC